MRIPKTRTLAAVLASAAAGAGSLAAAPGVLADDVYCPPKFSMCDLQHFSYGLPMQISGVETIAHIRNTRRARRLYAQLLAAHHLQMPPHPEVRIIFNDLRLGAYAPGVQDVGPAKYSSRYLEYGIELLAKYGPHIAWHDLRLALNDRAGFELGRGDFPPYSYGSAPKFLADNTYDSNGEHAGFATSNVHGAFVMRADWQPVAGGPLDLDPSPSTRIYDGTDDGDPWQCSVTEADLFSEPAAPVEWLTGQSLPLSNPTAMTPLTPVSVRVRLTPNLDQFNVPQGTDGSVLDPKPLPTLFPKGTNLGTLMSLDQENPGREYGPAQQVFIAETRDVTTDGPAAPAAKACKAHGSSSSSASTTR